MAAYLPLALIALLAQPVHVRADAADPNDGVNPDAQVDPDGVPLAVTQPTQHPITAANIQVLQKQADANSRARNWLLLEYEQQMLAHTEKEQGQDKNSNLYLQLSMDKGLAKLAGLQSIDGSLQPPAPTPLAGASQTEKNGPTLRPETSSGFTPGEFKPLITPLSSPATQLVQGFSTSLNSNLTPSLTSSIPGFSTPPDSASTPAPAPSAHSSSYTDVTDLQTPGMVAAKDDSSPDLSLDSLPGETPDETRARDSSTAALELPLPMDSDLLHKQQASKLLAPGPTDKPKVANQPPVATPVKVIPVNPEDAPIQMNQQPTIVPVHGPIANPYDILNR